METEELYFILDTECLYSNDHLLWWKPNSCGYTRNLLAAGKYTREEARNIVRDDFDKHSRAIPISAVLVGMTNMVVMNDYANALIKAGEGIVNKVG